MIKRIIEIIRSTAIRPAKGSPVVTINLQRLEAELNKEKMFTDDKVVKAAEAFVKDERGKALAEQKKKEDAERVANDEKVKKEAANVAVLQAQAEQTAKELAMAEEKAKQAAIEALEGSEGHKKKEHH